jgi:hypothetical protein
MKSLGRRTTEDITAPVFILREIHHLYVALHEGAEIQQQFDAYRAETGVDFVRLREGGCTTRSTVARLTTQLASRATTGG